MSPTQTTYVQKVIGISGVKFYGKIGLRLDEFNSDYHWYIGEDNLEKWLEKFEGKTAQISIDTHEQDESRFLPSEER